ncbi:DNA-3-methyladenine glycosylase family protein [Chitiniphilus eburneus]|uniref:DNA-3-methyladenine glycosylase II n=1 Tax=Chitiniphilus eburneus TaxID=2571148 RepID=A0A4U0PIN0_9NEIS|nr:DNA-3-methyladenine glycosylase [Chitiniphilus eburneus]TJZ67765.1 DNA-3-methyladenine glycosylase 2 family protein [Chitiniphilus eburneus]
MSGRPAYWDAACGELAARDPVMAELIARYPGMALEGRGDVLLTLARSIVGQQISVKAADTIWQRLLALTGPLEGEQLLRLEIPALRSCGLSQRKAEYLLDLARHHVAGSLDSGRLAALDDEAVIAALTDIRGIGRWTAEMFLIFHLMRPNVLPLDDIGLLKGIALHYHGGERLPRQEVQALAARWAPFCSVATWYLWRSLDPLPVSY